jgi:hypothetical protein
LELGLASVIRTKQISGEFIEGKLNTWLEENPDVEVIDIKFSASATHEDWATDVLIIYREEN